MKGNERRPSPVLPEVEELSDLQWARIERGLWAKLDAEPAAEPAVDPRSQPMVAGAWGTPRRVRGLAYGGVLAVAAVALLVLFLRGRGGVGGEGGSLEAPSRVATRDSATTISFADAAIEVEPHSAVLLSGSPERGASVVLERGRAGFRVAPRTRPFLVIAGHAMVRVVGTHFEVSRDGEAVAVSVREGKVAVHYLGHVHQVIAGQHWSSTASVEKVEHAALLEPAPGAESATAGAAAAADDPAAGGEASSGPSAPLAPSSQPKRPHPRVTEAPVPSTPSTRVVADEPEPSHEAPSDDPSNAPAPVPAAPADDVGARADYAAAARLEASAPSESLRRYLELSQRQDRWGATALFAAARLAFDIGQRERAAELARSYLRRFPRGGNAADARALLEAMP